MTRLKGSLGLARRIGLLNSTLFVLMLLVFPLHAQSILVIESYHSEYIWVQSYRAGLEEVLGAEHEFSYFQLDAKRTPVASQQRRATAAFELYKQLSPDLVLLADDEALRLLAEKFKETDTPVVYFGVNGNPRKYNITGAKNIFGLLERPPIKRSIIMLKKHLSLKRVLLLLDTSLTASNIYQGDLNNTRSHQLSGVHVDIELMGLFDNWQAAVLNAKQAGYTAVIAGLYHNIKDRSGKHIPAKKVIEWTSANSTVPLLGLWDFSVGKNKTMGGFVMSGYTQGKGAAHIVKQIFNGETLSPLPKSPFDGQFIFSKIQVEKWGFKIPEGLPRNSVLVD